MNINIHVDIHIYEIYCQNWLIGYGGQELQGSAIYKLENQESRWYNSVWAWRLGNQGTMVVKSRVPRPKTRRFIVQGQEKMDISAQERENSPFLDLFVLFKHPVDWWCLPTLVKGVLFTQSTESNATVFQKHSHRHAQK